MKYIIVFEDGQIFSASEVTEQDLMGSDSDVLDIIRLEDGLQYSNGSWVELKKWVKE